MKSSYTGEATIFRHEKNGFITYSAAEAKKNVNGENEYAYKKVKFRKGVDVPDHAKIEIKEAWESFYNYNGETVFYVFINKFTFKNQGHSYPAAANKIEAPDQFAALDEEVPF